MRDNVGKYLAKRFGPEVQKSKQGDLYGGRLQEYYVCERDKRKLAIRRGAMTLQERHAEVKYLMSIGQAYIEHAKQLQKETDALIAQGFFDRRA